MNASPTNLNPLQTLRAPSPAGKDASAPDVPFSQVLSGEIAQARSHAAAKASGEAEAKPDPARPGEPADGGKDAARVAKDDKHNLTEDTVAAPAADAAIAPVTLLALPIAADVPRPAADPGTRLAPPELASARAAALPAAALPAAAQLAASGPADLTVRDSHEGRKGRAVPGAAAGRRAPDLHDAPKAEPEAAAKAGSQLDGIAARTAQAAAEPAPAAAFAAQLAAAHRGGAATGEPGAPDLTANPLARAAPHAATEPAAVPADAAPRLAPPVGTTAWSQALGDRMVWMAAGSQQTVSLALNPPDLGPLQIVLNVTHDQATASFFSAQPEVRHALEAAFPRLREMMSDAGIQLGQATVSADTPRQQNDTADRQAPRIASPFAGSDAGAAADAQAISAPVRRHVRGLVDTFA